MDDKNESEKTIENLLKKIIEYGDYEESVDKKPIHVQTLCSTVEQYLSPFIIFGYDVKGNAIVTSNAKTQQDLDGLLISIGRYMAHRQMGGISGDIGDFMD